MSLDRDELAARLAAANVSNNGDDVVDPAKWAAYVVRLTDALLAALAPEAGDAASGPTAPPRMVPVAPASGAPATEPRRTVGAVVRWDCNGDDYIVVSPDGYRTVRSGIGSALFTMRATDTFIRWATREECERHGLIWVDRGQS